MLKDKGNDRPAWLCSGQATLGVWRKKSRPHHVSHTWNTGDVFPEKKEDLGNMNCLEIFE